MKKLFAMILVLAAGSASATVTPLFGIGDTDFDPAFGDVFMSSAVDPFEQVGFGGPAESTAIIEAVLGIPGELRPGVGSAFVWSAEVMTGSVIAFDWVWSSFEGDAPFDGFGSVNDFAFVSINMNGISVIASFFENGDIDFGSFSYVSSMDGIVEIAIGVVSVIDDLYPSYLSVGNLRVPAPATLLLLGLGLVGMGAARRRA